MASIDEQILSWNPWWADPEAVLQDPHLLALERSPFQWDPPLLSGLPLAPGDTHTLRGPRQAGKTTLVKKLIARLLEGGHERVMYFSFDLARDPDALYHVIRRAKLLHPSPEGPWHFFLDEVTSVREWQRGLKVAWDQGITRGDFILLTGSSAHDLSTGAEQLPGRRGRGADYLHLPMSFRDFCFQVEGLPAPGDSVGVPRLLTPEGRTLVRRLHLSLPALERALRTYAQVGGFPEAVRAHRGADPGSSTPDQAVRTLWNAIAGDVARGGRDQTAAAKLLEQVGISLGNPLKWQAAAKAMGMASGTTARDYVEYLSSSFTLLTVFFWDSSGGTMSPGKQRKVYYVDPLLASVAPALMPGARRPPEAGVVENLVAVGLFRSTALTLTQAGPFPGAVGYWRSTNNREIDFVVPAEGSGRGGRLPIEVKGDNPSRISHARSAIERTFGEGLVLSSTVFDPSGAVPVLPVPVFLATLADKPERTSSLA